MNLKLRAALRTAAYLATVTVIGVAFLVILASAYITAMTLLTGSAVMLLVFMLYMVYTLNLKELEREQAQSQTVDQ